MSRPDLATLFEYDDPAGSEERFTVLLKSLGDEQSPYTCELLTRLARTQGLQRNFEEAHSTLDRAEAMGCSDSNSRVRILLERGRLFNSAKQLARAKPLFEKAFELAVAEHLDDLAVDAAHMMGILEKGEASLAWNEKAIELAEQSSNPKAKAWFGSLYNNTAWTHHDSGNYPRALELFEKAKAFRMEQGQPAQVRIAEWCIARCLRSMGRLDEALVRQQALYAEGDPSGYTAEELGELHLALGKPQDAKHYYAEAHAKLSTDIWLQANEPDRLARLLKLGT